ncbi:MAG: bifunctional DNA primase/polymerase [Ardenticatenaceae bacterium]
MSYYLPVMRRELLGISDGLIKQYVRLMPVGRTKKPVWDYIPYDLVYDDEGKPVLGQYGTVKRNYLVNVFWMRPTTIGDVEEWLSNPKTTGLAALCSEQSGNLYTFDIDVERFLDKWVVGSVKEILTRHKAPAQKTGGGGYQIAVRIEGKVPGNTCYAYAPDESKKSGRTVSIESRGSPKGYILLPYSIHPSGNYYKPINLFGGSWDAIPTISQKELKLLEEAARQTCEAPRTKQQIERAEKQKELTAKRAERRANRPVYSADKVDVISAVNDAYDIRDILSDHGYTEEPSGRWSHPTAKNGSGVSILDNVSYHHSSNDPLSSSDGRARSPFGALCELEYGGDVTRAVKELAEKLGIDYASNRPKTFTYYGPEPQEPNGWRDRHVDLASVGIWNSRNSPIEADFGINMARLGIDFGVSHLKDNTTITEHILDEYSHVADSSYGKIITHISNDIYDMIGADIVVERKKVDGETYLVVTQDQVRDEAKVYGILHHFEFKFLIPLIPTRDPLPEWGQVVTYEDFDWKAFRSEVASKFNVAEYIKQNFNAEAQQVMKVDAERNVFSYSVQKIGGGPFQVVCFKLYGHTDTTKAWGKVLREAASFAGVEWPDFRKLGCTFYDVLKIAQQQADNFFVIELSDGQYLSDVLDYNNLAWGKTTHIFGGCGIGKSRAADNVEKKSFYTPMTRQALTFAASANARGAAGEPVAEGLMHDRSDSIFGTYDAAKKEIELINDHHNPLCVEGRTAFGDEIQHTNQDAYRKGTALEPLLNVASIYVQNGGRVVTLSGTPSPAYPKVLSYKGSDVIYVRRQNQIKRNLWLFQQSDPVEAILSRIQAGYTHITYSIDDKAKCEAIAKALTAAEFNALPIHSDNKKSRFHKKHVGDEGNDGQWDENVGAYITTRATVDGFSVRIGYRQDVRLAEMFDSRLQYGSQMIEQRSRRVRDHLADVFVGMSDKALQKAGLGGHFDFQQRVSDEIEIGQAMLESATSIKLIKVKQLEREAVQLGKDAQNVDDIANEYVFKQYKGWIKFDEDGHIELDELAIIQRITNEWIATTHATPDIMINELQAYGFEFKGVVDFTGDEAEAAARENAIKQEKKARKKAKLNDIKAQAETMSVVQAQAVRKQTTTVIKEEGEKGEAKVAAAGIMLNLIEQGVTEREAKKQILALTSTRKDKIERIENMIQMKKIRVMPPEALQDCKPITRFLAKLQDGETFKIGEALTSREFVKRVAAAAEACGVPQIMVPLTIEEKRRLKKAKKFQKRYDKDRKVILLMSDIYQIKRTRRTVGGTLEYVYEILGFVEIELSNS